MKTQHTPGPWSVCSHSWSDTSIYAKEDDSYRVCRLSMLPISEENQSMLESEMDANALLIAAAPDLLEALEVVENSIQTTGFFRDSSMHGMIQAAIAKAKGK